MHKKTLMGAAAAVAMACSAEAHLYGDTPDATHAWAVHDMNRPNPVKVTADEGKIPSDATVLFDGTEATFANWCAVDGKPTKWRLAEGALESVRGAGYIRTRQAFGDCQLHIEWASPVKVSGFGQGRGNSGVFLMGNYEIQVLDSYETDPSKDPNPNPNYADGQAGAVYAENPPLVNPSRGPGVWQSYDIVFHQPIWRDGKMVHPGSLTVFHNGVLVQDHWEMEGLTTHCRRRPLAPHETKLPLQLQDHGNPVRYRNIWIREIPSRYANLTHGGPAPDPEAVMALRRETAAKLFARIDANSRIDALRRLLEVLSYSKDEKYLAAFAELSTPYLQEIKGYDAAAASAHKGELLSLKRDCEVLLRNKVIAADDAFFAAVKEVVAKYGLR